MDTIPAQKREREQGAVIIILKSFTLVVKHNIHITPRPASCRAATADR